MIVKRLCKVKVLVAQLCPTLCDPMNYSLPGSSVHGIVHVRILEWVAIPFSRASSQPRDRIQVSCIAGRFFTIWDTREAPESNYTPIKKKKRIDFLHFSFRMNILSLYWMFSQIKTLWMTLEGSGLPVKKRMGTSLVCQWLRVHLPIQGTQVQSLIREDPTCHETTKPVPHNYWSRSRRAHAPQQEKPSNEKPAHHS